MIRRRFIEVAAACAAMPFVGDEQSQQVLTRAIPSSGERLPLIGMGTWRTFDAGRSATGRARLRQVLRKFFDRGGRLIDSSPMYGTSEAVVGDLLPGVTGRSSLFAASKVWIPGRRFGAAQMEDSRKLWGVQRFDLMQVHNLLDWEGHLATLKVDGGNLFDRVRGRALPAWTAEIDCRNWSQFFLKFVVSHPAVTCAIPATSQAGHMVENMGAGAGRLPDARMRARMAAHFDSL